MISKANVIATVAAVLVSANAPAKATSYPKVAFSAVYGLNHPSDKTEFNLESDGVGHIREKAMLKNQPLDILFDYKNGVQYQILESINTAFKNPLPITRVNDEETAKKFNAKSLGAKEVAGHPCHGWSYMVKTDKVEIWNGDDIDWIVQEKRTHADGSVITVEIRKVEMTHPPDADFKLPDGCTVKDAPRQPLPAK